MTPRTFQLPPGTRPAAVAILIECWGEPISIRARGQVLEWSAATLRNRDLTYAATPKILEGVYAVRAMCKLIAG